MKTKQARADVHENGRSELVGASIFSGTLPIIGQRHMLLRFVTSNFLVLL